MNVDARIYRPQVLVKPSATLQANTRTARTFNKRVNNACVARERHEDIRLLTAYANGPDRNLFVLCVKHWPHKQGQTQTEHRKWWRFVRKTGPLTTQEPFSQQHIINIAAALNVTPGQLAKVVNARLHVHPVPDIDWEPDTLQALLSYARREPLTVYHEMRVIMAVKNMPLASLTAALCPEAKTPVMAMNWAVSFLQKLDTAERLHALLTVMNMTPARLLVRLPQAL